RHGWSVAWILMPASLASSWNSATAAQLREIATFLGGGTSWQLGTFAVGNLDHTSEQEIVVPYRDSAGNWFLDAFKFTGQRLPGFPYSAGAEPINLSPTLYDLDGNGRQ